MPGQRLDPAEGPPRVFAAQVPGGVTGTHERDADLHQDRSIGRCVEGHEGAAGLTGAAPAPRRDEGAVPGADRGERAIEASGEVQRVRRPGVTELAARHLTADLVVADGVKAGLADPVGAVGHLEQDVGKAGTGKGELGQAGSRRHRQLGRDLGGAECHPVAPGGRLFAAVREGVVGVLGVDSYGSDRRKDGDVSVAGATGSAHVGETESRDVGVGVGVAAAVGAVGRGVGTPLHHPEGHVGAGELPDISGCHRCRPGAGQRVDEADRVTDQRGGTDGDGGGGPRVHGGQETDEDRGDHHQNHQRPAVHPLPVPTAPNVPNEPESRCG